MQRYTAIDQEAIENLEKLAGDFFEAYISHRQFRVKFRKYEIVGSGKWHPGWDEDERSYPNDYKKLQELENSCSGILGNFINELKQIAPQFRHKLERDDNGHAISLQYVADAFIKEALTHLFRESLFKLSRKKFAFEYGKESSPETLEPRQFHLELDSDEKAAYLRESKNKFVRRVHHYIISDFEQKIREELKVRLKLINKLDNYIDRIESSNGDFQAGFSFPFFKESRALNRKANYLLAKNLRERLDNIDTNEKIADVFSDPLNNRLQLMIDDSGNQDLRGINSSELNEVINKAKKFTR